MSFWHNGTRICYGIFYAQMCRLMRMSTPISPGAWNIDTQDIWTKQSKNHHHHHSRKTSPSPGLVTIVWRGQILTCIGNFPRETSKETDAGGTNSLPVVIIVTILIIVIIIIHRAHQNAGGWDFLSSLSSPSTPFSSVITHHAHQHTGRTNSLPIIIFITTNIFVAFLL